MHVSTNRYGIQIPVQVPAALSESTGANNANEKAKFSPGSIGTIANSLGTASSSLQASLAASALDKAGDAQSSATTSQTINPADYLTASDIKLYEHVTGGTIKDGVLYDKDGNVNSSQANMDLVDAMYQMRAHGTFLSNGNVIPISGDITADAFKGFIEHYSKNPGAFDMDVLNKALNALNSTDA